MPVKRRKPKVRIEGFSDWQVVFLETGELPPDDADGVDSFELIDWRNHTACPNDPVRPIWEACCEQIMKQWLSRILVAGHTAGGLSIAT